jgi:hypothetical protein
MRATSILFATLSASVLGACQSTEPTPDLSQSRTDRIGDLELTVITDRRTYPPGTAVGITMQVTNLGSAITLNFNSGMQFDFSAALTASPNLTVWNYAFGRNYGQAMTAITLQPGETWEQAVSWNRQDNSGQAVPPGSYRVHGTVTSTPGVLPTGQLTVELQ